MDEIELRRDGRSYHMRKSTVTTNNIALVFGLDPRTIWLKEVSGSRCYFPASNGETFVDLGEYITTLVVEGAPPSSQSPDGRQRSLAVGGAATADLSELPSTSNVSNLGHKYNSYNIKIVKADKFISESGKTDFAPIESMFIEVTSSNANIGNISSCVKKKWGDDYNVVTKDGLEICDSTATRGLKFWKVPNRKLYAVQTQMKKRKRKRDSSDEETTTSLSEINDKLIRIDQKLSRILDISSNFRLPLGFIGLIHDTFTCCICKVSPIIPPAIYARCCKSIIGCQQCIDIWYQGEQGSDKRCPLCRGERGYADTSVVLGLNEFLAYTDKMIHHVPPPPNNLPAIEEILHDD